MGMDACGEGDTLLAYIWQSTSTCDSESDPCKALALDNMVKILPVVLERRVWDLSLYVVFLHSGI